MDPGRRPVTLATLYLLVPLYHCEKMLETERTRRAGTSDDRRDRSADITCAFVFQLMYRGTESPENYTIDSKI